MKVRVLALALAPGLAACGDDPTAVAPEAVESGIITQQQRQEGSGLVLESLTGIALPIVGDLGDVVIDEAILTNFRVVETVVGSVVGLEATGILSLTGGVLGTDVVTEEFLTTVSVTSSGPGQCEVITIDLGPINIDALRLVEVDIPEATVSGQASGAVGPLLCALGQLLGGLTGGLAEVAELVNAINEII